MTDQLSVLPLGGCGEVGLNATLILHGTDALLIDCGALLGVWDAPGVDRAVPGFEPILDRADRHLHGIVLTHGHEDHIGALPALLQEVAVPVFGTPTTIAFARSRLERSPAERRTQDALTDVELGARLTLGPFTVELIHVNHSIPEAAAVAVETPSGRLLHSGDFKMGDPTDVPRLRALGEAGVDLLLSDSTNAEVPGRCLPEAEVAQTLRTLVAETRGRAVIALFASHLHRIKAAVDAARADGRRILIAGAALERTWKIGVERGLLPSDPTLLLTPEGAASRPRREVLVLATGTQGELGGGLSRIAGGKDSMLLPQVGDRIVLSARTIPGNEKPVRRIVNQLARAQIEVVNHRLAPVHCSGHAHSEEQAELIRIVQPRAFVPVHGERTMLEAHRRIALDVGMDPASVAVVENGASVSVGESLVVGDGESVSKRMLDQGWRIMDWGDVRDRRSVGRHGLVSVALVVDSERRISSLAIRALGCRTPNAAEARARSEITTLLAGPLEGPALEDAVRSRIRAVLKTTGSRPPAVVLHFVRLV